MTEYKLVAMGDGGVGKTALTIQLCSNHFVEYYDPTIESSYRRQVVIDDNACILEVLDTAGQEEYTALRAQWIRSGEGFLIIYSITDRNTFEQVEKFRRAILQDKDADYVPIVLVGNKCDMEERREVTTMEGSELAKSMNARFFEASAKNRLNVDEAFFALVRMIKQHNEKDVEKIKKVTKQQKIKKHLQKLGCTLL